MDSDLLTEKLNRYLSTGRDYGAVTLPLENVTTLTPDQKERVKRRHAALEQARQEYLEAVRSAKERLTLKI
jgi:cytidylate kinase